MNPLSLVYGALGAVAAALSAYLWGHHLGYSQEHEKRLQQVATITATIDAERDVWTDMMIDLGSELTQDAATTDANLKLELAVAHNDLGDAIARLHKRPTGSPSAPAKPADAAPAECRAFEAAPALLPVGDRELFLRLGDEANRAVLERNSCVTRYNDARKTVNDAAAKAGQ